MLFLYLLYAQFRTGKLRALSLNEHCMYYTFIYYNALLIKYYQKLVIIQLMKIDHE